MGIDTLETYQEQLQHIRGIENPSHGNKIAMKQLKTYIKLEREKIKMSTPAPHLNPQEGKHYRVDYTCRRCNLTECKVIQDALPFPCPHCVGGIMRATKWVELPPKQMKKDVFIEECFEIAFGDNAIKRDFSREEVLKKLREYSNNALKYEESL